MKRLFFGLLVYAGIANAGAVQVPESCANRVLPCLIRAEQGSFRFMQNNIEVRMTADSLIKISGDSLQINFEIISGYVALVEKEKSTMTYSLNNVMVDSSELFASRSGANLEILSLNNFAFNHYLISEENFAVRKKGEFINKKELVYFTRHFFSDVPAYKKFLVRIESEWSSEFKRQNVNQTKALLRSIASEQKQQDELFQKKQHQQQQLKKLRDDFFYRTFYR